jgi:hypothetical protein
MRCETGPAHRAFGGTQWTVYSCADEVSVVFVSAKDSPASPFVFILAPVDGAYQLHGEGNGDQAASQAAGDAMSRMTPAEIAALLEETKARTR